MDAAREVSWWNIMATLGEAGGRTATVFGWAGRVTEHTYQSTINHFSCCIKHDSGQGPESSAYTASLLLHMSYNLGYWQGDCQHPNMLNPLSMSSQPSSSTMPAEGQTHHMGTHEPSHRTLRKLYHLLKTMYWCPNMIADIYKHVSSRTACAQAKVLHTLPAIKHMPLPIR